MKKRVFFIGVFCLLVATVSNAQAPFRLGVKAGANIADVSLSNSSFSTGNMTGFEVGPMLEWLMIKNHFGIDAAVLYSQRGIKIDDVSDIKIDKNVGYLDIPVNLKWVIGSAHNFKPYLSAGPYISFNLSGKDISDQWEAESFGAGMNFGAGIQLFRFLQVGANYGVSLTDDYKTIKGTTDYTAKSRTWSITAAVLF